MSAGWFMNPESNCQLNVIFNYLILWWVIFPDSLIKQINCHVLILLKYCSFNSCTYNTLSSFNHAEIYQNGIWSFWCHAFFLLWIFTLWCRMICWFQLDGGEKNKEYLCLQNFLITHQKIYKKLISHSA